jgi:hypothetical protein
MLTLCFPHTLPPLGIVQIQEATTDEQSEKSSVRSSSDTSLRLVSLHEITLSRLMAAHAASVAARCPADNVQDSQIFNSKWLSSRDPMTKVYTVQSHAMYSDILVATTSVGVIVLTLKAPISANSGLTAFHPDWKNLGIFFSSDKKLQLCRLYILGSSEYDESSSPRPASTRRSSLLQSRNRQQSRVNSARYLTATAATPVPDDKDPYNPTGLVQLEVIEDIVISAEGVGGSVQMAPQTLQKQPPSGKSNALLLACVTSRPIFRASPSGKYCAVHWPESLYYVVLEMNQELCSGRAAVSAAKTREVDRGQCVSLGWMSIPSTPEDSSSGVMQRDLLLIICPSKRLDGMKKKKQYTLFKKKDNTPEGCLPAMLLLKAFTDDGTGAGGAGTRVVETVVSGGPSDDVDELFGGGAGVICINSVSKMNDSGASDEKKKKAISQIELEAMQAQQAEEKAASGGGAGASKADEIPVHVSFKSQFFALKYGAKTRQHSSASTMDESTSVASTGEGSSSSGDYLLSPIGPVFDRVTAVAWDTLRSSTDSSATQYLAVLIDFRVNLLQLTSSSTDNTLSLSTLRSMDVSSCSRLPPTSLIWRDGFLFVSNHQEIVAIFPRPSCSHSTEGMSAPCLLSFPLPYSFNHLLLSPADAAAATGEMGMPIADSASLCSLTSPTQVLPSLPPLPPSLSMSAVLLSWSSVLTALFSIGHPGRSWTMPPLRLARDRDNH